MRLLAIVNPISGRTSKARVRESILGNIDTTKYEVAIEMTQSPGHTTELAEVIIEDLEFEKNTMLNHTWI